MNTVPLFSPTVVIVGAGHAGGTLAGLLRQQRYDGRIVLFGDETHLPYHRPPLSKKYTGDEYVQLLRPRKFYDDNDIDVRLDKPVVRIDRHARTVTTTSGNTTAYNTLVLATGAAPRTLSIPGSDLGGVATLRTLGDAGVLRDAVLSKKPIAIVGGGYVGLEVAASARVQGCDVTVIEREHRVLSRVASTELAQAIAEFHRDRGTRIVTDAQVKGFAGYEGQVTGVQLNDGSVIPCELALVGVGAIPNDSLAREAEIDCEAGIVVDGSARTNDPDILAIGDVTYRMHDTIGRMVRLESIPSAVEQAKHAAAVITGLEVPAHEVPWFWSDQFDLKMKMAGMVAPGTTPVVRGNADADSFAVFHLDANGVPVAVETVNAAAEFMAGKKYIANRTKVDPLALADSSISLREVVL
ncbi:ferredoxin reductase [Rhodococcus sp. Eu-32]|uniref:NAD(P)/FAD-dependent oxidoreductase n=1 Tax=Rhodococcus sp. Eu-32 TaxID=1017319 RepID=UPI000DF36F83|nr:FAD-dependent oxidoreductase [Rhodococcus sp. Eu-32]RRQ25646.1 ferredoxin reductase [Rhodococcus sp. Eu-32]